MQTVCALVCCSVVLPNEHRRGCGECPGPNGRSVPSFMAACWSSFATMRSMPRIFSIHMLLRSHRFTKTSSAVPEADRSSRTALFSFLAMRASGCASPCPRPSRFLRKLGGTETSRACPRSTIRCAINWRTVPAVRQQQHPGRFVGPCRDCPPGAYSTLLLPGVQDLFGPTRRRLARHRSTFPRHQATKRSPSLLTALADHGMKAIKTRRTCLKGKNRMTGRA